jgi:hypothetical protein
MVRNIVLAVSTLAVLIILFLAYTALVGGPAAGPAGRSAVEPLAAQREPVAEPLRVGEAVEVPAGGKIMFRRYDEHTGRPRDMFLCQDWQPVPNSKNEIHVTGPELATLLPSGMVATISADQGQVTVDRVEQSQMRPKLGWLAGNVQIVVDRETRLDRTPRAQRPQDLITISVDRLAFDLEIGELKTEDRVVVQSDDFEIAGVGLHLIWNQADNRIETLSIARGEEFVLYAAAGLFGMTDRPGRAASASERSTGETPVPLVAARAPRGRQSTAAISDQEPAQQKARRPRQPRRTTAYACVLDGGLVAEQYRGEQRVGGLAADQVELLFDVGGGADRFLRSDSTEAGATTRPAREQRDRLVLRWNGRLQLEPTDPDPRAEQNRRHFVALGDPVVMTRGDAQVRCGQVVFHDDTQRVWLYPTAGGTVEFGMGENLSATAQSIYVDRAARLVKLVGQVELSSRRGTDPGARASSIRSAYWAELRIAESSGGAPTTRPGVAGATAEPLGDVMMDADRLESATFVGQVQVDLGPQKLTAHRLDVGFRPQAGGKTLEELLDTATASGNVELTSGDSKLACAELGLAFNLTADGSLYPKQMDAAGAVRITRGRASISGDRVLADLVPPPESGEQARPLFVIRFLDILGQAELIDPDNKVAARGRQIAANFEGVNQLTTATVHGSAGEPGLVHARPYTVRGEQIDLDRSAQTVHVDGPSRLGFKTRRSLQGREREQPTPVVVTSTKMLHIDGRQNELRFVGQVAARSEEEQLQGSSLTLRLEDVAEPEPAAPEPSLRALWRQFRRLVSGQEKPPDTDDLFALRLEDGSQRARKEPVWLTAEDALVSSETYEQDQGEPVVHASISAPRLEVDIVNRQIFTAGLTDLLMTDRRGLEEAEPVRSGLGALSALVSRGPSQTAMRCAGRMVYTLGPEGPGRRDAALFEDRVVFVHRTGKEMVNLERMLPEFATHPELLDTLQSRNASLDCDRLECWFAVDEAGAGLRRGGALTRTGMRLASLTASGSVYLRDQQGSRIREVNAAWVEFNREQGRIHVRGSEAADARVYFEDASSGQFDVHAGDRLVINLQDGTVRSDKIVGQMRRP